MHSSLESQSHQSTDKLIQAKLKQLIPYTVAALVLYRRQGVLGHCVTTLISALFPQFPSSREKGIERELTVFDPEVYVYLVQHVAHARRGRVGQEDESQVGRRLVVVQLVLARAEADKGVVVAAELACHVAEREDGAEDELGVVVRGGVSRGRRRRRRSGSGARGRAADGRREP